MKKFTIINKVVKYDGPAAWYFVHTDKKLTTQLRDMKSKRGWGSIKVKAKIGKTSWATSLFPNTRDQDYIIAIKAAVRHKEAVDEGDTAMIECTIQ